MTDVGKTSIFSLLIYFIIYIVLHYLLITVYNKKQAELQANKSPELEKYIKYYKFFSRWFPAIYVIFLLIVMGFF